MISLQIVSGSAPAVYIAQSAVGGANGSSCANAYGLSFFNASANWGSGSAQIGPGTTVHLCGTFTAAAGTSGLISVQASGTSSAPITLVAEPGVLFTAPYWGQNGAITAMGLSYIVLNGQGQGTIQATANGTNLANQAPNCGGLVCSSGIYVFRCDNCTVENWTISNMYVNVPPADESNAGQGSFGIFWQDGNNVVVSGNTIHDAKWCLMQTFASSATTQNVSIFGNTMYNCDHGVAVYSDNSGAILNNVAVYGNTIRNGANWDDNADGNHHDGIHLSPSQTNTQINYVYLYDNYIYGDWGFNCNSFIYLAPGNDPAETVTHANVFNNLLVNTSTTNTCANGLIQDYGAQNTLIANNTLIGSTQSSGQGIILEEANSYHAVVKNNILANFQNGFYVGQGDNFPVSDFNVFFNVPNVAFVWGSNCCSTLSNWQAQAGNPDVHSSTNNPNLNGAYIPQNPSSAIQTGTNLTSVGLAALDADRAGTARPATGAWDIGAYASGALAPITVSVSPGSAALGQSGQQQFSATVTGSNNGVSWSMAPVIGTLSLSGLYTAPATISAQQQVTVTATSVDDANAKGSAVVTLNPPPPPVTVSVTPGSVSLGQNGQQQFTATVTGSSAGVTWSMSPAVGTLSAAGFYTAPASIAATQQVKITATVVGTSVSAFATVTLNPPPPPVSVTVSPASVSLAQNGQQQFTATVTGSSAGVTWSMSPSAGTLSAAGLYTAPASITAAQQVKITATVVGTSVSAFGTVTLNPPPPPVTVSVAPVSVSLGQNGQQQFAATVTGSSAGVTWSMNPAVGTLSAAGLYTAPASITATQQVKITASVVGTSVSASGTVTLNPPMSVTITPGSVSLGPNGAQQFTASVAGSTSQVVWSISPQVGNLSSSGMYTAPSQVSSPQQVTVTATVPGSYGSASASAVVTLAPQIGLVVTPGSASLRAGQSLQFSATLTGLSGGVVWSMSPQYGTLSQSGLYTAPTRIWGWETVTVTARSQTNPSISATATITLHRR